MEDELVSRPLRGRFSGNAVGGLPVPCPATAAGIQHAPGGARRRADAHRARTARHAVAERAGADVLVPGGAQPASGRTEEAIRTLDQAIREGDEAIAEGRDAIQGLRANPALESNLEDLLTAAGKELARSSSAEGEPPAFRVTVEGARQPLSPLLQDEVYRIAREILRNAFHHAHASRIEAEIAYDGQFFRLRIRDNGKGIDRKVLEARRAPGALGIAGRPRARETHRGAVETLERTWCGHGSGADRSGPNCLPNSASPAGIAAVS